MDCDYTILHHNQHGYVVECHKCGHIKMAFGTTALTFNRQQFYCFMQTVEDNYEANRGYEFTQQKHIQIPTAAQSVQLVYSLQELEQLKALVTEGYLSLEIQQLLHS